MKTFTIENETSNITVHATKREAATVADAQPFGSAEDLAGLAAEWPAARLVEIWNSIPGTTPVKKFKDRKTAVERIWQALQSLGESVQPEAGEDAEPGSSEQPETGEEDALAEEAISQPAAEVERVAEEPATVAPEAPQGADTAPEEAPAENKTTRAKKAHTGEVKPKKTREGSKTEIVLGLMKQPGGTTLKAIMGATNWQAHSVRGFISGTLRKKMGLTVVSAKGENGERTYSIQG